MDRLGPLRNRKSEFPVRNEVLLYKQLIPPWWIMLAQRGDPLPHPCPEATGVTIQVSSPCYWCPLVR
jgi:hypothetical protein